MWVQAPVIKRCRPYNNSFTDTIETIATLPHQCLFHKMNLTLQNVPKYLDMARDMGEIASPLPPPGFPVTTHNSDRQSCFSLDVLSSGFGIEVRAIPSST